jgi:hypothetical protein
VRLKRVNFFGWLSLFVSRRSLLVRPATACLLFTVLRTPHSNARFGQAQLAHLSSSGSCRVPPRKAALRASLKRSVPYDSRVRVASARVPGHKVAPPRRHQLRADAPDRSCRAAAPSSLRRAPAQTRRADQAPEHAGQCDCASACCSSAVSQACVSLVVRGVGRRSSERQRRRRTSGCCCRSSGSLPNASRRAPPTASARGTHNRSQRFVAVVLVLLRQMRTRKVGLAARRHAVTASCRTLGTLAHYSYTHCTTNMPCRFELLSSFSY